MGRQILNRVKAGKIYAVAKGRVPGIYCSWKDANAQINRYPGGKQKSFKADLFREATRYILKETPGINVPIFLGDNEKDTATDRTAPPRLVPKLPHRRHDRETVAERSISKRRINQTSAEKVPIPEPSPVLQIQSQPLVLLSEEQKRIYDHILAGKNTFFSGPAGSGKSLIIKHVLRDSPDTSRIAITAPTGVAAILIDGKTVHSWSGLGKAEKGLMYYTNEFTPGSKNLAINRWNGTELLILDEVSMVHPDLFETLNMIGKIARGSPVDLAPVPSTKPFGGLQLVVSGDFFQLPPVDPDTGRTCFMCGDALPPLSKRVYLPITHPQVQQKIKEIDHECLGINPQRWMVCTHVLGTDNRVEHHRFLDHISINTHEEICHHLWNDTIRYAFQTRTWEELGFNDPSQTFFLKTVHRQTNQAWIAILKKLKLGVMDNETMDYLESLKRPLDCEQAGVQPTKIFALRKDADAVNKMEFNKLKGPVYTYEAVDQGIRHVMMDGEFKHIALSSGALEAEKWYSMVQAQRTLKLKWQTQVMLNYNLNVDMGLVNGARGVITGFLRATKAQFITLTKSSFYSNFGDLSIHSPIPTDIMPLGRQEDPRKRDQTETWRLSKIFDDFCYYESNTKSQSASKIIIPIVNFRLEANSIKIPVPPIHFEHVYRYLGGRDIVVYRRTQLPLSLSWATTAHKSQGSTMEWACVDFSKAFAPGLSYVALSRCRSPDRLQILNWAGKGRDWKDCFMVDDNVKRFYARMKMDEDTERAGSAPNIINGATDDEEPGLKSEYDSNTEDGFPEVGDLDDPEEDEIALSGSSTRLRLNVPPAGRRVFHTMARPDTIQETDLVNETSYGTEHELEGEYETINGAAEDGSYLTGESEKLGFITNIGSGSRSEEDYDKEFHIMTQSGPPTVDGLEGLDDLGGLEELEEDNICWSWKSDGLALNGNVVYTEVRRPPVVELEEEICLGDLSDLKSDLSSIDWLEEIEDEICYTGDSNGQLKQELEEKEMERKSKRKRYSW